MRDWLQFVRDDFRRWRGLRTTRHIGRRLLILYAITVVLIVAVFSITLFYSWVSGAERLTSAIQRNQVRQDSLRLQAVHAEANSRLLTYLIAGDERSLNAYRGMVAQRHDVLTALGRSLDDKAGEDAERRQFDVLRLRLAAYDTAAERVITDRRSTAPEPTLAGWRAGGGAIHDEIVTRLDAFIIAQEAEPPLSGNDMQFGVGILALIACVLAAALLGLWVIHRVILGITTPLETLAGAAAAIGAGQLETRVAPGLSAEFDMLGSVMNGMAARLAEARQELQGALAATERRNYELRAIGEVGDALDRSLELTTILDRGLAVVLEAFAGSSAPAAAIDTAVVLLAEEVGDTEYWSLRDGRVLSDDARDDLARALRAVAGDAVIAAGRALTLGKGQAEAALPDALQARGYGCAIAVPLKSAMRARGALVLLGTGDWRPDARDLALLEQVGGQIARAAENALLYVAEKQRSAEAGILAQMAQLMSGTLDLDRLARLIARYAVRVLGVDRCIVGFYDRGQGGRDTLQQIYQYGFPPQQMALMEGGRETLQQVVRRYMLDGRTLVVPDVEEDQRAEVRALARAIGARSFISVPLVARERQVGLIYLDTRDPRQHPFGPPDQRILAAIADQAAAALEGARLYEAERRRAEQLRVLNQAGHLIAVTPDLTELFAGVVNLIRDTFGYDHVTIGLIEEGAAGEQENALAFVASAGEPAAEDPQRLPLAEPGPATRAAREGRACSAPDGSLDSHARPVGEETHAELAVPLKIKERTIGVLSVQSARAAAFDEDAERVLASIADQLGIAIENNRLHDQALTLAVVDERNRLARELHDSVTQGLFSMNLTIEAARMLLRRDVDAAEQQLAQIGERTREAMAEMRALIHSLRPAGMEEQGLVPALRRWVERVRRENLLPVELAVAGTPRLREPEEQELFRIVQEALNNVIKHAAATRAQVTLVTTPDAVTLTIEDDGKGFDPARASRPDAFGLLGMRERAATLGGSLALDATPGGGTRVRVVVPLDSSPPAPIPANTAAAPVRQAVFNSMRR